MSCPLSAFHSIFYTPCSPLTPIPRILSLNSEVFDKSYKSCYLVMGGLSIAAFVFLAIICYLWVHFQRWDDISPCSKSLTPGQSCTKLPPTNIFQITFDHSTIAFGGCYTCSRYLGSCMIGSPLSITVSACLSAQVHSLQQWRCDTQVPRLSLVHDFKFWWILRSSDPKFHLCGRSERSIKFRAQFTATTRSWAVRGTCTLCAHSQSKQKITRAWVNLNAGMAIHTDSTAG